MYVSVADMRNEGVTESDADDVRLCEVIADVTAEIDAVTEQFFRAREPPRDIRRAAKMLVLRWLPKLTDDAALETLNRARVLEERTRDQSYRLAPTGEPAPITGDVEIDRILLRYRPSIRIGAA